MERTGRDVCLKGERRFSWCIFWETKYGMNLEAFEFGRRHGALPPAIRPIVSKHRAVWSPLMILRGPAAVPIQILCFKHGFEIARHLEMLEAHLQMPRASQDACAS